MIELPHSLASWKEELSIFPEDVALTIGPWLPRLDLAFGPLTSKSVTQRGEIDGFSGLSRRGPYERLLISEWLLALELPEEFARRAAMGEHAFLETARREPKGSTRSVVLFDTGPSQLGGPRIAHLAALVVLARRAARAGAMFGWGVLQKPEGWYWAALNESSVLGLFEARSARETTAIDLQDWLERLDESEAPDDLWIIGAPRLSRLARELPADRARTLEKCSRLDIDDILEPGRQAIRLALRRPKTPKKELELELPDQRSCVRLLRDPFQARGPSPIEVLKGIGAPSNLLFSRDSRKLFVRNGPDTVLAFHPPASPHDRPGAIRMLCAYGDQVAAVGSVGRAFHLITSDSEKVSLRGYSRRGMPREVSALPDVPSDFPFWHPGAKTPLQPCDEWRQRYIFLDAVGRLLMIESASKNIQLLYSGVTAMTRFGGALVVVRNAWESEPQHHANSMPGRAIILLDSDLTPSSFPAELDGDGDLSAFFGYPGPRSHHQVGLLAMRRFSNAWTIIDRLGPREIILPPEVVVCGVTYVSELDSTGLVAIEKDRRSLKLYAGTNMRFEGGAYQLLRCDERVAFACVAPSAARIAWLDAGGAIHVYSLEYQREVYRVTPDGVETGEPPDEEFGDPEATTADLPEYDGGDAPEDWSEEIT